MDTLPLFELPAPAPLQRAQEPTGRRASRKPSDRPRWSAYKAKEPERCDDCLRVLVDAKGAAPLCRRAKWKRVYQGRDLLLCSAHSTQRRADDGLAPLKDNDGRLT